MPLPESDNNWKNMNFDSVVAEFDELMMILGESGWMEIEEVWRYTILVIQRNDDIVYIPDILVRRGIYKWNNFISK